MTKTDKLRQWLGDEWGKMLVLLVMLSILPVSMAIGREWAIAGILFLVCLGPFIIWVLYHRYRETERVKILRFTTQYLGVAVLKLAAPIAVVLGVLAFIKFAYTVWYPHVIPTSVYTNGNWMQGEKRTCVLSTAVQPYQLDCTVKITASDLEPHRFDISYTGANPVDQHKDRPREWTCTRAEAAIACSHEKSAVATQ